MENVLSPFVVEYTVGDGIEYSATAHAPILAKSKAAALDEFNVLMAAYVPDGLDRFLWCGQVFEYRSFVYWYTKQKTPRRSEETYDVYEPTIYSVQEWIAKSLTEAAQNLVSAKVTQVDVQVSPSILLQAFVGHEEGNAPCGIAS